MGFTRRQAEAKQRRKERKAKKAAARKSRHDSSDSSDSDELGDSGDESKRMQRSRPSSRPTLPGALLSDNSLEDEDETLPEEACVTSPAWTGVQLCGVLTHLRTSTRPQETFTKPVVPEIPLGGSHGQAKREYVTPKRRAPHPSRPMTEEERRQTMVRTHPLCLSARARARVCVWLCVCGCVAVCGDAPVSNVGIWLPPARCHAIV